MELSSDPNKRVPQLVCSCQCGTGIVKAPSTGIVQVKLRDHWLWESELLLYIGLILPTMTHFCSYLKGL